MAMFNPVKLIDEVKLRPGLWSAEYPTDREEKLNLWKEVGAAIYLDWGDCNKATAYDRVLQLQRKWRSLRDAYNRELRSRRSGVRINKRVYMYFKRMSFLGGFEGSLSEDELQDDASATEHSIDDPLVNTTTTTPAVKKPKKRRAKIPSVHSDPPEEFEVSFPVESQENEMDSDKLFLLSFLPEMRQLPVNVKMWARAQIATIMQEAVGYHYNNTMPPADKSSFEIKRQRRDSSE